VTDESGEVGERPRPRRRQSLGRTGARFPRLPEGDVPSDDAAAPEAVADPTPAAEVAGTAADPLVGRTGARFASRARRTRRARADEPLALPPGPSSPTPSATPAMPALSPPRPSPRPRDADADPLLGRTGARFDSRARRNRREAERQAAEDSVVPVQAAPVARRIEAPAPPPDDTPTSPLHLAELRNRAEGIESRVSVRPYVRTRGRTHARVDLRVETLVSIPSPRPPFEDPEHRTISDLCDGPRSVAEVAALMRVPLGVARILIADMADDGTLTVHPTVDGLSEGPGPDRAVMARVLRGLHRL
jgi:hypothetical protein